MTESTRICKWQEAVVSTLLMAKASSLRVQIQNQDAALKGGFEKRKSKEPAGTPKLRKPVRGSLLDLV
jgi:hypothetical protein